jgi:outer membrane protein OmpA-like peptidoglycan-associated protein
MISSRQAVAAAVSLLTAIAVMPSVTLADPPPGNDADQGKDKKSRKDNNGEGRQKFDRGDQNKGGLNNGGFNKGGLNKGDANKGDAKKFGGGNGSGFQDKKFDKNNKFDKAFKPNGGDGNVQVQEKPKFDPKKNFGDKNFGDKNKDNNKGFGDSGKGFGDNTKKFDKNKDNSKGFGDNGKNFGDKNFGDKNKDRGNFNKPVVINPNKGPGTGFDQKNKNWPTAGGGSGRFDDLRKARKVEAGGKIIQEPGNRTIFKDKNNRFFIQHDDNERLRRVAPNARFEKGKGGNNISIVDRGKYKIYSETDSRGQLIRRYRRGPDGRDVYIIDNRRRHGGIGKGLATGIGIGIGVAAGAAILDSIIDVPEPRVRIPRDKYIVDYDSASDDDVYEALSAPPIDDYSDRYSLDEIRATARLRDRMRRVDLDDITFEFGSWDVDPSQYGKLERIARAMQRVIDKNPNEVFLIEGYTDAVGSPEDNLSLSDRRAESVAEVMTEQFQIPFENLSTQGYGEDYLKVPTDQPERLNRRVAVRRITPLMSREGSLQQPDSYERRGDATDPADRDPRDEREYSENRSGDRQQVDDAYRGPPTDQGGYQTRGQDDRQGDPNDDQAGDQRDNGPGDQADDRSGPPPAANADRTPPPAPRADGRPFEYGPYHANSQQN